ncbi:MAG: YhcB family protein [bacterium]
MSGDAGGYHRRNLVNGRSFMVIEWVVGIAVVSLLVGVALGYFLPLGNAGKARVNELENALETAQQELADYKGEVYSQFATTAEKFRDLDQSYQALHQQLARSSVDLCGDAAMPLLAAATTADVAQRLTASAEVDDVSARQDPGSTGDAIDEEAAPQRDVQAQNLEDEIVITEAAGEGDNPPSQVEVEQAVPTLTERDAEFTPEYAQDGNAPAKRGSA